MKIDEYITNLRKQHNVVVGADGGELKVRAKKSDLTTEILEQLRERKSEILAFFDNINDKEEYRSIQKTEGKEVYHLSPAQKRLHYIHELANDSTAYNMTQVVKVEGKLDHDRLNSAFDQLLTRYDVLRTSFVVKDEQVFQKVADRIDLTIEHYEAEEEACDAIIKNFIRPFDLKQAPLIRVGLINTGNDTHILMVDVHHIITDGISQEILLKDFLMLYNETPVPELNIQYKDYTEWLHGEVVKTEKQQKEFWLNEFSELPTSLQLMSDFPRPVSRKFNGEALAVELSQDVTKKLEGLAEATGSTMFMVMLSVYNVLLSKLSNQEDIVVGTPTAGRQHAEIQEMVGLFLNNIALRNNPDSSLSFYEFLNNVKLKVLNCFENQSYQFDDLITDLKIERDPSRNPLFDTRFVFQDYNKSELKIPGLKLTPLNIAREVSQFDLTLYVESGSTLKCSFNYSTEIFKQETVERFISYFKQIVAAVIAEPTKPLNTIELVTNQEKQLLLGDFNNTSTAINRELTVVSLFDEQVRNNPHQTAVSSNGLILTYAELNSKSNAVAHALLQQDILEGTVGICAEPSLEMAAAILGVLKAGYAFIPLNPESKGRNQLILEDGTCSTILTQQGTSDTLSFEGNKLVIDDIWNAADLKNINRSKNDGLAYIIYTSGSTGKPKGVKITHANVVNYAQWFIDFTELSSDDKSVLTSSFAFDLGYTSIFPTLLNGGELHLISENVYKSPSDLMNYIQSNGITYLKITPSLLSTWIDTDDFNATTTGSLRYVVLGGEHIKVEHVEKAIAINPKVKYINHYGPSETTIGAIAKKIEHIEEYSQRPTIGKPINNTQVFIVDKNNNILPIGVAGELCIAGEGVGNGYVNKSEETATRFITNLPYADRLYKTGDMARWLPDGTIEILGRIDDQVKINGYRIELEEINQALLSKESVTDSVVVVKQGEVNQYVVAYYVSENQLEEEDLRTHLSEKLAEYMLPSQYVWLERIPLTPNGKVDKRQLPTPEFETKGDFAAPDTEMEKALAQIWSTLLKMPADEIGVNDHFFDLGGNSLSAIRLNYNLQKQFQLKLEIRQIFENPTIKSLADLVEKGGQEAQTEIKRIADSPEYLASSAQERLYYEYVKNPEDKRYNVVSVYNVKGGLDIAKTAAIFEQLVNRHESLRTSFALNNAGEIVQSINDTTDFKMTEIDTNAYPTLEASLNLFTQPFDLSNGCPIRVGVFQNEGDQYLIMCFHHIICDGLSKNMLISEFRRLYEGEELPSLKLRYIDYAAWQKDITSGLSKQKEFWMNQLSGMSTGLELPRLGTKEDMFTNAASYETLFLKGNTYTELKELSSATETSDYMLLLAVSYILLSKITGSEDIAVGTDVAGRNHPELNDILGTFVNLLPLRVKLNEEQSFDTFLREVKKCVLDSFEHEDLQYNDMVNLLKEKEGIVDNLFDVHFTLVNYQEDNVNVGDLQFETVEINWGEQSEFELKIHVIDEENRFRVLFIYNTELYDADTINLLQEYFNNILEAVINDHSISLVDIQIESEMPSYN